MARRWVKFLNPEQFGCPAWVQTVRPLSHVSDFCVTWSPKPIRDTVHTVATKAELFEMVTYGKFNYPKPAKAAYTGPGAVIGERPFKIVDGRLVRARGGVFIGPNVEIGANTVIARGIYGESTEIHGGAKIDNLVNVGHSAVIGARSVVGAGTLLGVWSEIGEDCLVGVGVKVLPHIKVGNGCCIGAGTVVTMDIPPNRIVYGVPARIEGGACCRSPLEFKGNLARCWTCQKEYGLTESGEIQCLS